MELCFDDIIARRSLITPPEVVSLALALAAQLIDEPLGTRYRPSSDQVLLNGEGEVVVRACDIPIASGDEAAWLAQLVCDLLGLEGGPAGSGAPVPGGLLLLLARALRQSSLPPATYPEFLSGLTRFGTADRAALAAVHHRCAAAEPAMLTPVLHLDDGGPAGETPDYVLFESPSASHAQPARRQGRIAVAAVVVAAIGVSALAFSSWWTPDVAQNGVSSSAPPPISPEPGGNPVTAAPRSDASGLAPTSPPPAERIAEPNIGTTGADVTPPPVAPARRSIADEQITPSPDGRRIAFLRAEATASGVRNLWVRDVNTGAARRVTNHVLGQPTGVSWFPDGRRFAYAVDDTLVIAEVNSGRSQRVKSPVGGRLVRQPEVSPDGTSIAFQVLREGTWTYELATGEFHRSGG